MMMLIMTMTKNDVVGKDDCDDHDDDYYVDITTLWSLSLLLLFRVSEFPQFLFFLFLYFFWFLISIIICVY